MDSEQFSYLRNRLGKTQRQMAQLFGTSEKAIQGNEQGWRKVPMHVEQQALFLVSSLREKKKGLKPCWVIKKCPPKRKKQCPAWEFRSGRLCWFINGTICECKVQKNWHEKMKICRSCEVFSALLARLPEME
ncbi:MAG: transcriptional regulator [Desulfobacteraceae bacterium]|nr:MAG: transcriptional regulator [Desulfobacteraceae bacterium]